VIRKKTKFLFLAALFALTLTRLYGISYNFLDSTYNERLATGGMANLYSITA